jgi:hypothetical protein
VCDAFDSSWRVSCKMCNHLQLYALYFLFTILIHVIISYRIIEFEEHDVILLFAAFNVKVVHGWLSDPDDNELFNVIGNCTRESLLTKISNGGIKELLTGSSNPSSLGEFFLFNLFV